MAGEKFLKKNQVTEGGQSHRFCFVFRWGLSEAQASLKLGVLGFTCTKINPRLQLEFF